MHEHFRSPQNNLTRPERDPQLMQSRSPQDNLLQLRRPENDMMQFKKSPGGRKIKLGN